MQAGPHLPDPGVLECDRILIAQQLITLLASTSSSAGVCPVCGSVSSGTHSRYTRTLTDLPWHSTSVRLPRQVRRFFCDAPTCPRRIFVERVHSIAAVHARKTGRMGEALTRIGLALGGQTRLALAVGSAVLIRSGRIPYPPFTKSAGEPFCPPGNTANKGPAEAGTQDSSYAGEAGTANYDNGNNNTRLASEPAKWGAGHLAWACNGAGSWRLA